MEYGSDLLALERVKLMTLAERGLLATMRWHLWANDTLPRDPAPMARLLGLEAAEVQAALTDRVLSFFAPAKGAPDRLMCPELAAQMQRLMERRDRMVQGAHNSHTARKEKGKPAIATQDGTQDGTHGGSAMASELNCTAPNRTALGKNADISKALKGNGAHAPNPHPAARDEFVVSYEAAQAGEVKKR
jgi:hypothetical protein